VERKILTYRILVVILSVVVLVQAGVIAHFGKMKYRKAARPAVFKGQIAIVLDDWGYNANNEDLLEEIKYPLTISVLPDLPYSQRIALAAGKNKQREVILHLPMEPLEKYRLEKNTILTSMDEATISGILDADLAGLAHVRGVSNHMGSKATADMYTMGVIFKKLKQKKLYFLDSLVSSASVCQALAREAHLEFAKRDVFIDNQLDPASIKAQLYRLKTKARALGQAIGIGHDHTVTLEVLKEVMPQLDAEGYRFVLVSQLIK
jgi:uncharacterized protein